MPLRKLARHARESWEVPRDLLLRRYPPFVSGGPLPRGHVPVFVFHSLEPETFAPKLAHLADNGYATLSADEYVAVIRGEREAPERAVLLTFDDGRASLFTVGLPLMLKYGMKGMVFAVPGRMDVRRGAAPTPDEGLLTWDEAEALAASGLFDVQSHTLTHARVHTAPVVEGFLTPERRQGYAALDVPVIQEDGRDLLAGDVPLGTPLLRSEPRTGEVVRFHERADVRRACVDEVAAGGGVEFFRARGWERRLRRLLPARIEGRAETPEERAAALRRELGEARRLIAERIGQPALHLCYPWHAAGPDARRIAREAGYETAFWGKVPGVPITLAGGDLTRIARIGEDYMELLPGRGRLDLRTVLRRKWARRLRGK